MIKANFTAYGKYVTDSLYQWDINRILTIKGLNLEQAPEIHFYNSNMGGALVRQGTLEDGVATVKIPNGMLQEALTIRADVCIYEGDVRKTIEAIEIPVIPKARPLDYTFTDDEEVYSYNALKKQIDEKINESLANLNEAIARYNTLIDEYGRIIGDYPGLPDRMTEVENITVQSVVKTQNGTGVKNDFIVEFDKTPIAILISEGTGGISGLNATINYGTTVVNMGSDDFRLVTWENNKMTLSQKNTDSNDFNKESTTYLITLLY